MRRALEMEPGNKKYCNNLALAVGEQGRREEAYSLFRRAGSETQARANLAFVLAQQGEYEQSLQLYDRVLTEDQSNRVAADAMIELSKRASGKGSVPAPGAGDGQRAVLASHQSPEPTARRGEAPSANTDRKSTRLNSSHSAKSRMPSSA